MATSSVERFSENFEQEAVTYLIFFVGMHWFQKCNFWKNSLSPIWSLRGQRTIEVQISLNPKMRGSMFCNFKKTGWKTKFGHSDLTNDLIGNCTVFHFWINWNLNLIHPLTLVTSGNFFKNEKDGLCLGFVVKIFH